MEGKKREKGREGQRGKRERQKDNMKRKGEMGQKVKWRLGK